MGYVTGGGRGGSAIANDKGEDQWGNAELAGTPKKDVWRGGSENEKIKKLTKTQPKREDEQPESGGHRYGEVKEQKKNSGRSEGRSSINVGEKPSAVF